LSEIIREIEIIRNSKRLECNNGDVYEGYFLNNKRTGWGKLTPANGKAYEGRFKNGKYIGK